MPSTLRSTSWLRTVGAGTAALSVAASLAVVSTPAGAAGGASTQAQTGCPPVDYSSPALDRLRSEQQQHNEAFHKFPDVIEVGSAVWEDVWEWHVRVLQQAPTIRRTNDFRHALEFRGTLVVLRADTAPNYFGVPFDWP